MKISDKTHDRIIHQLEDFEHLDGAREIFAILNGNI